MRTRGIGTFYQPPTSSFFIYSDAPLDLRIKSNLIADLLSLAGKLSSGESEGGFIIISNCEIFCTGVGIRDPVSGEVPKAARKGGPSTRAPQVCRHLYYKQILLCQYVPMF